MDYTPVNDKYSHLTQTNKQKKRVQFFCIYYMI